MRKLSGKSIDKLYQSYSVCYHESNKIEFAFFWFFYDFLCILQDSAEHKYYLRNYFACRPLESFDSLQICPYFSQRLLGKNFASQLSPWPWPAADRPKSGEPVARVAGEKTGKWPGAHHASVWGWRRGGDGIGEWARRRRSLVAAGARLRRTGGLGLVSKRAGSLEEVLGEVLEAFSGDGN
jgi:hypothetical protein